MAWAKRTFGSADLGDQRRNNRLVGVASVLAAADGASPAQAFAGDQAGHEGAYRFFRNEYVVPELISEAGFRASVELAGVVVDDVCLAIEDTTTLGYSHVVAEELGDLGGPEGSTVRGFHVHSVLMVARDSGCTIGLVEQRYWMRQDAERGKKHRRKQRAYEDKESFKWEASSRALRVRFGEEGMRRIVAVCDREADVYEYLADKLAHGERFVVRASSDRTLDGGTDHLWPTLEAARVLGYAKVDVPQRGGRVARTAKLTLRAARVKLRRPKSRTTSLPLFLKVRAVLAREQNPPPGVEPLEWLLLTNESTLRRQDVLTVLRTYRRRWRIEEFHKVWKSGVGVERCRMQSPENIHRLAAILAFVAIRVVQLREAFAAAPAAPCTVVLDEIEWKVLWLAREKKPLPAKPPTVEWAYHNIGILGGWYDSKRTGRVGPKALVEGWGRLEQRVAGYRAARFLDGEAIRKK